MMRGREFMFMDVYSITGDRLGRVDDLLVNFHEGVILGFKICKGSMFTKKIYIGKSDIISINSKIIVNKNGYSGSFIEFKDIKGREVISISGLAIGVLEEIICDEMNFKIKGLIVSKGFIENMVSGKKILLQNSYIIGEHSLLCIENKEKLNLVRVFHDMTMEVDKNEKNI